MNGAGDAAVTVAVYQLVSEAVVLAVGAHTWVCEIHIVFFRLLVSFLFVSLFHLRMDVKVFRRRTNSYYFRECDCFWFRVFQ